MIGPHYDAMDAINAQLTAHQMLTKLISKAESQGLESELSEHQWRTDVRMLEQSAPFAWAGECVRATLAASESIPLDTMFNKWTLGASHVWWHFEEPLPWQTSVEAMKIRALCFGGMKDVDISDRKYVFGISCWTDDPRGTLPIMPSQTMTWRFGETLGEMLAYCRFEHQRLYGPNGPWRDRGAIGEDKFMAAAEGVARFILAGLAWLNQKVVVAESSRIERHRRKEFERKMTTPADLKLVHLRRSESKPTNEKEGESDKREYSHRFVVNGHFRNQACGPGWQDRRLTWIGSFVKGPDDKPLVTRPTAYVVER
jgi:hypothetical protein